jgi:hypothetical protein
MLTPEEKKQIDDEEIVEKYILEQLNNEEKNRFEQLLSASDELRKELEFNALTIAAIRQYSRTELKKRIKESLKQVPASPAMAVPKSGTWMYIRAAALILLFMGGLWMFYQWMSGEQSPAPIVEDTPKKSPPVKEQLMLPPKQETISEYREPVKNETTKKSVPYKKSDEIKKPQLMSMPSDSTHGRSVQKFAVNPALFPKPNEVKTTLDMIDDHKQIETKIYFKNPSDLSAVDITATHEEKNGALHWFYVHYDNQILNVYLDNTKYLNIFKNSKLIQQKDALLVVLEKSSYQINLKDNVKFKKATITR